MQCTLRTASLATMFAALALCALTLPGAARAERSWVRAEVRLNLRTGPGANYRIVGTLATGDAVTVIERGEKWTKISLGNDKQGWIPAGYLQTEAPPTIRLGLLEREVVELRGQLETITAEREGLQESNTRLTATDQEQSQQVADLSRENRRLKGGQRWPEWITGAAVLCVGMLLGALWNRTAGRRAGPRIRL
jgi:SH3 domain protein